MDSGKGHHALKAEHHRGPWRRFFD